MSDAYGDYLTACRNSDAEADELLDLFDRARLLTPVREVSLVLRNSIRASSKDTFRTLIAYYTANPS